MEDLSTEKTVKAAKKRPATDKLAVKSKKKQIMIQDGGFGAETEVSRQDTDRRSLNDTNIEKSSNEDAVSADIGRSTDKQMEILLGSVQTLVQQQVSGQSQLNATLKSMGETIESLKDKLESPQLLQDEISDSETSEVDVAKDLDQLIAEIDEGAENEAQTHISTDSGDKSRTEECDELLKEIAGEYSDDTETGPALNKSLAQIINDAVSKKVSAEKAKQLMAKYNRPKNCNTEIPKVNPEIWTKLPSESKSKDIKMQKMQKHLEKAIASLSILSDKILTHKTDKTPEKLDLSDSLKRLMDAITLTGLAQQELSLKRRELIRPDMNPEYRQLCSAHVPVTKFLFGDDLFDLKETNRVAGKLGFQNLKGKSAYKNKGKPFLYQRNQKHWNNNRSQYQKQNQFQSKWKSQKGKDSNQ